MTTRDLPHDTPERDRPAKPETAEPTPPPVIEYPKMLYHADGRTLTVANAEQEAAAAKDGFSATPGGTKTDAHPKRG